MASIDSAQPNAIASPTPEDLTDFSDALGEHSVLFERDVQRLKLAPHDRETVTRLFRSVHNIKGDAALCRFPLGVRIAHPMETTLARLRSRELHISHALAEALLLAIDRLQQATALLRSGQGVESLRLEPLIQGLSQVAQASGANIDDSCDRLIETVTGFPSPHGRPHLPARVRHGASPGTLADLAFFRELAQTLDRRSPMLRGRSQRTVRLALDTNREAGEPLDPVQLEAAVLMHDVGMLFLPDELWLKPGQLTEDERVQLARHPELGAGLLERMPGWAEAAAMVRQHHERPDGAGYPKRLTSGDIAPGAQLLAIVDAFEAVMLRQAHRGRNRSVLRAIAEVNATPEQFSPTWILPFNLVIRRVLETA